MSKTARLNPRHQEMVRAKIQASHIIRRLQLAFNGKLELSKAQIDIARILLSRSLPELVRTEMTGLNGGPVESVTRLEFVDPQ